MKLYKKTLLAVIVAAASITAAQAAPVLLGSVNHLYGSDSGRQAESVMSVFHPGGNCDTLNAASITVRATASASCNRFADIFDFSSIDFASIDHFDVTLAFSGARDGLERWKVRGAQDYVTSATTFGADFTANGPQTFTFSSATSLFTNIVSSEQFVLSFTQSGLGGASSNFALTSARIDLFGTSAVAAVPEPSSLALVGLSLAALGAVVRRSRKGDAG